MRKAPEAAGETLQKSEPASLPPPPAAHEPVMQPVLMPDIYELEPALPGRMPVEKAKPQDFYPQFRHRGEMMRTLGPKILRPPYNPVTVIGARYGSPTVADCVTTLLKEIFRQPIVVEPAFASRCEACDLEFNMEEESCPNCGGGVRTPDPEQERLADEWLERCNENGMSLTEFAQLVTDKAITFDDAFILLVKDYQVNTEGTIEKERIDELWLGSTERIRLIFDESYQRRGYVRDEAGKLFGYFTCILHRDMLYNEQGHCNHKNCGLPLWPCVAVGLDVNGVPTKGYLDSEVLHWSPKNGTEGYGFSRIQTLMTVIRTIAAMDVQQQLTYAHDRPPKGIVSVNTKNAGSLQAELRKIRGEMATDPNHMPWIAVDSDSKSGGVQFVPLTQTYQELDNLAQRRDLYQRVWSSFQVEPIFMADTSASGGLNNEGRQLTVGLREVEAYHHDWHGLLFPFIEAAIGLTDYHYRFPEPQEKDKAADTMLRMQNLMMRVQVERAGGTVKVIDEDSWEFRIEEEPDFSLMPDAGGGGAGGVYTPRPGSTYAYGGAGGWGSGDTEEGFEKSQHMAELLKATAVERAFYSTMVSDLEKMLQDIADNLSAYRTPEEQQAMIDNIVGFAVEKMALGAEQDMATALLKGIELAGADPVELDIDLNAVRAITEASPVWESFADMSDKMSKTVGDLVRRAFLKPGGADVRGLTRKLSREVGGNRHKLRRIARTESNRVTNVGRELGYKSRDPDGEYLYKWSGGLDARTCDAHRRLIRETAANPLPLEVLKARMAELAREQMGPGWTVQDWTIHPNQRGHLVRTVKAPMGKSEWDETKHPRAEDGKFTDGTQSPKSQAERVANMEVF